MTEANRRKYPRANYPCQLTMWMTDGSNETILANTSNIGQNGLCVHLNQEISPGTKADIILTFRDPTPSFSCRGVVVRCKKESEKFYNIGIQFDPLSESKHAFLEGQVSSLIDLEQKEES